MMTTSCNNPNYSGNMSVNLIGSKVTSNEDLNGKNFFKIISSNNQKKPSIEKSYEENIKLVKQAIKIKTEPNTSTTKTATNNDEDIEMITID